MTVQKSVKRLKELDEMATDGRYELLPKKEVIKLERERKHLQANLAGIKNMNRLPDAIFVIDSNKEQIAVREARKLGIPVVAVVDTNCDPSEVDYVIPGNDDALRAIRLFASKISDSVAEGAQLMTDKQAADLAAAVYAEPEAAPAAEAAESSSEAAGAPKPGRRISVWKMFWVLACASSLHRQGSRGGRCSAGRDPDVLNPSLDLSHRPLAEAWFPEENQTRAGRPARVKVCKDISVRFRVSGFRVSVPGHND